VDDLERAVSRAFTRRAARDAERLQELDRGLAWLSPGRVMQRLHERAVSLSERMDQAFAVGLNGRRERLRTATDRLARSVGPSFAASGHKLQGLAWRLGTAGRNTLEQAERNREQAEAWLARFDPMAPLGRGYALVRDAKGRFIRTVHAVQAGDAAEILLIDGTLDARIDKVRERNRR
jgi:exodeoxyribonuclease VII large subunit